MDTVSVSNQQQQLSKLFPETFEDAPGHSNSLCNLNSKSSCNFSGTGTVSVSNQQQQLSQISLRKHSKMLQFTATVTVTLTVKVPVTVSETFTVPVSNQ